MVKVSITLPNNAQITFESEEPEVIHEIVGMVLRDLPRELMQASGQVNSNGEHHSEPVNGNGKPVLAPTTVTQAVVADPTPLAAEDAPTPIATMPVVAGASPADSSFIEFCQKANPLGDMRRVVVAAEGARRFLGAASVDADELGRLFDLAGWPRPHSFVQTLRNAARSKFRWLERVPGRSGYYIVTELGRKTALG